MLLYAALVALLGFGYLRLPESFVPLEDQGSFLIDLQLPAGATQARTQTVIKEIEDYLLSREAMSQTQFILGFSFSGTGQNAALGFTLMKDWSLRGKDQSVAAEVAAFNQRFLQSGRWPGLCRCATTD